MNNNETASLITICSLIFIVIMTVIITIYLNTQNEREQKVLKYQIELEHNFINSNQVKDTIK